MMIDTPFMTSAGSMTVCLLLDAVTVGFIYIYIYIHRYTYIYKWGGVVRVSGVL